MQNMNNETVKQDADNGVKQSKPRCVTARLVSIDRMDNDMAGNIQLLLGLDFGGDKGVCYRAVSDSKITPFGVDYVFGQPFTGTFIYITMDLWVVLDSTPKLYLGRKSPTLELRTPDLCSNDYLSLLVTKSNSRKSSIMHGQKIADELARTIEKVAQEEIGEPVTVTVNGMEHDGSDDLQKQIDDDPWLPLKKLIEEKFPKKMRALRESSANRKADTQKPHGLTDRDQLIMMHGMTGPDNDLCSAGQIAIYAGSRPDSSAKPEPKYKIKLQPGDYARRDMGEDKYRECAQRFLDEGCYEIEGIGSYYNEPFFGWFKGEYHSLYHGAESAFNGRLLTYEQIMELEDVHTSEDDTPRYMVDQRPGIIAVIDTKHPECEPLFPGLHSNLSWVVASWLPARQDESRDLQMMTYFKKAEHLARLLNGGAK